jgi:cysteine sulfinate desulfinase/cysteine desulfurase-like protein
MIYLDNAATSPIFDECLKIIEESYRSWANPNAIYRVAKNQKKNFKKIGKKLRNILILTKDTSQFSQAAQANQIH